jgi:hypothetical protein
VRGNAIEFQRAVILIHGEEKFQEGDYANLLLKRVELLQNVRETGDVLVVSMHCLVELRDLAAAQSVEEHVQPLKVRADQTLQDLLVQKLHDIVNVLAEENRHAQFD